MAIYPIIVIDEVRGEFQPYSAALNFRQGISTEKFKVLEANPYSRTSREDNNLAIIIKPRSYSRIESFETHTIVSQHFPDTFVCNAQSIETPKRLNASTSRLNPHRSL